MPPIHIDPNSFLDLIKCGADAVDLGHSHLLTPERAQHLKENLSVIEKGSLLWAGKELPPKVIENLKALGSRVRSILDDVGGSEFSLESMQDLPFGQTVDILDQAQLVDDDELRGLWASLLASSILDLANGGSESSRRAFASLLRDLSPLDAVNLRSIYSVELTKGLGESSTDGWLPGGTIRERDGLFQDQNLAFAGISTSYLPDKCLQFDDKNLEIAGKAREPLTTQILVSLSNLARLNLIEPERMIDGGFNFKVVFITPLGLAFSEAVFLERRQ
ncbi:DUF4393 domain-containing protein [Cyanobium sp. Cruz CV13-4-11]|uniref:Abi-alpha family protein n=1 Tax=unclassified Cyanobium TaxID=2627006 RepID=UPI0020CE3037|nr:MULTISPECIES: Abi-alpha family protein [unclassified Cyanobium]MCP9902179.1 DUF4393 domain-containing protein [Cyanobium sp. Cruz CV11-17]MCP9921027.1 DUF4393 domain-containing protein [Cyanobium sp. Cruz CV13-4-11]